MAKEFIVAIELGSSKMTGIAGKKNPDGSISVLAVAREDSTSCIRKGGVYNIDKTAQCLTNIVNKLKTSLRTEVAKVYVGVGGQSLRSIKNVINKDLPADTVISQDIIDEIIDANRSMTYPDYEILDAATQEYKVDAQYQTDPVGIQARRLEGNFVNIIWRKSYYRNLRKCFDSAGVAIAEMYPSALVLAEAVLTEQEKRAGCVLVDLGADTTTVAVFHRDILRSLSVIPLGGSNITRDIESLQMEPTTAEKMKLKYASAFTDVEDIDVSLSYPIDADRTVESRTFINIVEARVTEIVENANAMIPAEYVGKLLGGIILTGGASNMPNMEKAFRQVTGIEKVRTAKYTHLNVTFSSTKISIPHDGTMNTILGLLAKGDMNCAGAVAATDLFTGAAKAETIKTETAKNEPEEPKSAHVEPKSASTEPEKPEVQEEEEPKPVRRGLFGRLSTQMSKFLNTITEPDNND